MSDALRNLRLVDGEEVLWVGRPGARRWWDVIDDRWDVLAFTLAGALALGGAIASQTLPRPDVAATVAVSGPMAVLGIRLVTNPVSYGGARHLTDRYVVTSMRAAIVKEAPHYWVSSSGGGVDPVIREILGPHIAEWRRGGPHLIVHATTHEPGDALVFRDVDDPESGARALDSLHRGARAIMETA